MNAFRFPVLNFSISNLFRISNFVLRFSVLVIPGIALASPHDNMKQGLRAYETERYQEAVEAFQGAAAQAPDARLDPAIAVYNRANALFRMGRHEEASSLYQDALRSTDIDLQQAAHFNRGNALMAMADARVQEQDLPTAKQAVEQALTSYENALALSPEDEEAKANYELAYRYRRHLEEMEPPPSSPQQEPGESEDEDEQEEDRQPPPDQPPEGDTPPPDAAPPDDPGEQPQPEPMDTSDMTEEEIRMLLDALRDEEQIARERNLQRRGPPQPVLKDW